jgi:hypothetical protein
MANPNPDLQGWADRVEDPEWMENALARVRSRQKQSSGRTAYRRSGIYTYFDEPYRVLLDEAASRRGMGMAAYLRRAAAAFIAHDLGIPFTEVVKHGAQPDPRGTSGGTRLAHSYDDGRGMGPWLIEGLREK